MKQRKKHQPSVGFKRIGHSSHVANKRFSYKTVKYGAGAYLERFTAWTNRFNAWKRMKKNRVDMGR